jgi:hypothetical protein
MMTQNRAAFRQSHTKVPERPLSRDQIQKFVFRMTGMLGKVDKLTLSVIPFKESGVN